MTSYGIFFIFIIVFTGWGVLFFADAGLFGKTIQKIAREIVHIWHL